MSHRRKKFLSLGIAGVLCYTVLLGAVVAADKDTSFTRMFPELPPLRHRPMQHVIRPRSWVKKAASSTPWIFSAILYYRSPIPPCLVRTIQTIQI